MSVNKQTRAQVDQIMPLTDSILRLHLIPEQYIDYEPGQYLQITSAGELLSYSVANAPLGSHKYELHIRHKGNPYQQPLFKEIRESGSVIISLPYGDCHLNRLDTELPIIFIAGGTGFAPIKAMIEQLLATGDKRQFELYWGARSQSDLYLDEQVQKWQTHVSNFSYFSQHSDRNQKDSLAESVLRQHGDALVNYQIVFAGPFDMIYSVRDKLLDHGIERSRLYSDAFSFEARS